MIKFHNVSKVYQLQRTTKCVFSSINLEINPGERWGVIGRNGAGKSTLIRMAAGIELPTSGSVSRTFSCSWPLGFIGGFQSSLTGEDNIKFIARIYNRDYKELRSKVDEFSELGAQLRYPIGTYSSGMRARFAFGVSLCIDFDCLLVDEVIAVGDERFRSKCHDAILGRADRSMLLASHDIHSIREYCNKFLLVTEKNAIECQTLDEAQQKLIT